MLNQHEIKETLHMIDSEQRLILAGERIVGLTQNLLEIVPRQRL